MTIDSQAEGKAPRVQSVARAVRMVDLVARSDGGLTAKEISVAAGINRSATYHLLHTLTQTEVLAHDGRRYRMGLRAGVFAAGFERHQEPRVNLAASARKLAAATREPVIVAAWNGSGVSVLGRIGGSALGPELRRGFAQDTHARATGKLLLALGPRERFERYLATHSLPQRTRNTIADRSGLERELQETRERGYAVDKEEFLPGVCCIAGPFETGRDVVALAVLAPTRRFHAHRELLAAQLAMATLPRSSAQSVVP